jgi:hypothetical protein
MAIRSGRDRLRGGEGFDASIDVIFLCKASVGAGSE